MARRKSVRTLGIIGVCIAAAAILAIVIHILNQKPSAEDTGEDKAQTIDFEHLVVDAYFENLSFREDGHEFTYSYRIPKINVTGNEAARMSYAIDDDLKHYLMDAESLSESGADNTGQPDCTSINYEWYLEDQTLLSLITTRTMHDKSDDRDHYRVYSYRLDSAREASSSTVISSRGYSYREYSDKVKEALMSAYLDKFGKKIEKIIARKDAVRAMAYTISDKNVAAASPFYDSQGNFCIVANLIKSDGSKTGDYRINLESFKSNKLIADFREDVDKQAASLNKEFADELAHLEAEVGNQKLGEEESTETAAAQPEPEPQTSEEPVQEEQPQPAQTQETQAEPAPAQQEQQEQQPAQTQTPAAQETPAQTPQEEPQQEIPKEDRPISLSANDALIAAEYAWNHFPHDKADQEGFYYETYIYIQPTEDNPYYTVMLCVTNYNGSTTIVSEAQVDARTGEVETKDY